MVVRGELGGVCVGSERIQQGLFELMQAKRVPVVLVLLWRRARYQQWWAMPRCSSSRSKQQAGWDESSQFSVVGCCCCCSDESCVQRGGVGAFGVLMEAKLIAGR